MKPLQKLEQKIRQVIPELKEEFEAFEDGSIDRGMITPIMLNHVLGYIDECGPNLIIGFLGSFYEDCTTNYKGVSWNLKSPYLKDQSEELINFLNNLK